MGAMAKGTKDAVGTEAKRRAWQTGARQKSLSVHSKMSVDLLEGSPFKGLVVPHCLPWSLGRLQGTQAQNRSRAQGPALGYRAAPQKFLTSVMAFPAMGAKTFPTQPLSMVTSAMFPTTLHTLPYSLT